MHGAAGQAANPTISRGWSDGTHTFSLALCLLVSLSEVPPVFCTVWHHENILHHFSSLFSLALSSSNLSVKTLRNRRQSNSHLQGVNGAVGSCLICLFLSGLDSLHQMVVEVLYELASSNLTDFSNFHFRISPHPHHVWNQAIACKNLEPKKKQKKRA